MKFLNNINCLGTYGVEQTKKSEIQMFQIQGDAYFRTDLKRLAHKILMLKSNFKLVVLKYAQIF